MAKKIKVATLQKFDATRYLSTPERIAEFLSAAIEEASGDHQLVMYALNTALRAQSRNMTELAAEAGITRGGLYDALTGRQNPSLSTLLRLLGTMGMNMAITPVK